MSVVAKTYTFVPGTDIESAEVNQNFDDVVNYINGEVIVRDASKAFTAIPSGPSANPSSDDQFSRKRYVDDQDAAISATVSSNYTTLNNSITALTTTVTNNNNAANTALALRTQGYYINASQTDTTSVTGGAKILVGGKLVTFDGNGNATVSFSGFTNVYAVNVGVAQGTNGPMAVVPTGFGSNYINVTGYDQVVTIGLDNVARNIKWNSKQGWVSFTVIGN